MRDIPEINSIEASTLTGVVRQALTSPTAEILHWEHHPISYIITETANLGVHRFSGTAHDQAGTRPWSLVLKAVHAPVNETDPTFWNYHRREILAYQDGLLTDLPGGLSAPRCLGVTEVAENLFWLWLEEVGGPVRPRWTLAEFGLAARHLGQFNGAYAAGQPLPAAPWLSRHWLQGWLSEYAPTCRAIVTLVQDERFWEQPLLRPAFPQRITPDLLRLWESHDALLGALDRLPRTFCHRDAYRPNLTLRRSAGGSEQTVAIDWVFAGVGGLGEEIANLLVASLIWFECEAAEAGALDDAVFAGYLAGLREAGWHGDARLVRLGFTAASALRWGVVGLWWMRSLSEPGKQAELERKWGRPLPELIAQWATTTYHVLGLAREAYALEQALF